jgi:hypothetical protein
MELTGYADSTMLSTNIGLGCYCIYIRIDVLLEVIILYAFKGNINYRNRCEVFMNTTLGIPDNVIEALATGRKEVARQTLLKLVNVEPTNMQGWLYLAVALPRAQAILALRRALVLEPGHQVAQVNLKKLYDNRSPYFCLELKDIDPNIKIELEPEPEEEAPAFIGYEQSTVNLNMLEAKFGEESPTLPEAFRYLAARGDTKQETDQLLSLAGLLDIDEDEITSEENIQSTTMPEKVGKTVAPQIEPQSPPQKEKIKTVKAAEPALKHQNKPSVPPSPTLTWVKPERAAAKTAVRRSTLPVRELSVVRANLNHSTSGAADSGVVPNSFRPDADHTPLKSNARQLKYAAHLSSFTTYGFLVAMLVITMLFSLYWFLG